MADSANTANNGSYLCDNCPTVSTGPTCACCGSETYQYPYCLHCNERVASCTCGGGADPEPGQWGAGPVKDHPGYCCDCGQLPSGCYCV